MAESQRKTSPFKRIKTFPGRKEELGKFKRQLSLKLLKRKSGGEQRQRRYSHGDDGEPDGASEVKNIPERSNLSARGKHRTVAVNDDNNNGTKTDKEERKFERESVANKNYELSQNKKEDAAIKSRENAFQITTFERIEESFEGNVSKLDVTSRMQSQPKSQDIKHNVSPMSDSPKSKSTGSSTIQMKRDQPILNAGVQVAPNNNDEVDDRDLKFHETTASTLVNGGNEMVVKGKVKTKLPLQFSQLRSKTVKKENPSKATDRSNSTSPDKIPSIETKVKHSASKMVATSEMKGEINREDMATTPTTISHSETTPLKEANEGNSQSSQTRITKTSGSVKRRLSHLSPRKNDKTKTSPAVIHEGITSSPKYNSAFETGAKTAATQHSTELLHDQKTSTDQQKEKSKDETDIGLSKVKSVGESDGNADRTGSSTTTPKDQWRKLGAFVRSGSKRLSSSVRSKVLTKDRTHFVGNQGNTANDSVIEESNVPDDAVKGGSDDPSATKAPENVKDEASKETEGKKKPPKLNIAPTNKSQERATHYKLQQDTTKLNKEWVDAQEKLNSFVDNALHSLSDDVDLRKQDSQADEIMTSHWDDEKQHKTCPSCEKSFSERSKKNFKKKNKPDHCRKCGRVFCKKCLQNTRRLNTFAQYDPFGKDYPVCSECYRPQKAVPTLGVIKVCTKDFKKYRQSFIRHGRDEEQDIKEFRFNPTFATCIRQSKRLVGGYRRYLQDKELNPVLDISNVSTKVPEWQKAPTWVDPKSEEGLGCQLCRSGRLDSVHNCRLCGRRVCSQDSNKNFMLYLPDQDTSEHSGDINPLWKMIQIVGCPEREPAVKLYLRICFNCQEKLEILQEKLYQQMMVTISTDYEKCEKTVLEIHRKTQEMKKTIQTLLPQFREKVNNLATDPKNIQSGTIKEISKQQDDLMEQFPRYIMAVEKLREMSPQTEQQVKLVRNLILEKQTFYKENVTSFRLSVRQLVEILPNDVMQEIKDMVNRDVINNTYCDLTQLAIEIDHISKKYQLSLSVTDALKKAKQVCEGELKTMILKNSSGDATQIWNSHKKGQEKYAESKAKSDARFLQPNESEVDEKREYLPKYIKRETLQRVTYFSLQLKAKSSTRNFKKTKTALEELLAECRSA